MTNLAVAFAVAAGLCVSVAVASWGNDPALAAINIVVAVVNGLFGAYVAIHRRRP